MASSSVTATMEPSVDDYNSDSSSYWEPFDVEDITWISIVLGAIVIITIVGNVFVMIAFARDSKIRNTVSNLFILNLSIADCIVGLSVLPIDTSWVFLGTWPYGKMFCQIWIVIDYTTAYMSVLMITLISLDRFWLVTKKLRYRDFQTRRQVKIMIASCWIFSFSFYAVVTFVWEPIVGESVIDYSEDCELESIYNAPFTIVLMFMEFIIPLIVISILNSIVYINIKRRSKGMVKPPTNLSPKPSPTPVTEHGDNCSIGASTISLSVSSLVADGKSQKPKIKDDHKTEYNRHRKGITLAIIVGVFLTCWLPYYVVTIYTAAICEDCVSERLWTIVNYMLWCNSTINPLLYAVTNIHYRRNFARFLGVHKCVKPKLLVDTGVTSVT
ncbi:LOW QUALITY PROTEIN: histamine H3 receptor-like [Amphiura filiformis]|uniref:LOW QUALITY PROTEIN: histamine H3 receptor-like n=1 Tax=Amphiura filiformis TaxID=82378 RepID=UPI003B20F41E